MPCTSCGTPCITERRSDADKRAIKEQKAQIDELTRWLCFILTNVPLTFVVLGKLQKTEEHGNAYSELLDWWTQHQKHDRQEARKKALAKLTIAERKLLGLDK
jgi:hypothetical protein